jgi:hypothetical protein
MGRSALEDRHGTLAGALTRHEDDLYTWVQEQVGLLRAGRLDAIDVENIAEELGDVGRSEFAKLQSALEVLLTHMLKWDHQPERISRSWDNSIDEQRRRLATVLADNPGLKSRRAEALDRAYPLARNAASSETGLRRTDFAVACPYSWTEILERPFAFDPPDRP